ncbi:MAG: wax ester/triacylglycerol synthase family O-acyltransferase [Acidimicrobiia bacterium]|nr:wax ester/triacylglycerol synthase family O-acyltransferase [Acidimicrobiia bacterium]
MRRVSGLDAAFLYGETSAWHMHVSALMVLDPSTCGGRFSSERFRDLIASRLHVVPQFRWKLKKVPFGLDRPVWVDDADFELDFHIRRIAVPAPGGMEQLGNLVGELIPLKLDRTRPLWEMWIIEGLDGGIGESDPDTSSSADADGGKVAILAKVHHSIIDGASGAELMKLLFDMEPDAPVPPAPAWKPESENPSGLELLGLGLSTSMKMPFRFARLSRSLVRQGLTVAGFARRGNLPAIPFQAPRTRLNAEITPSRRMAMASVPLDEVKAVKHAFDVKVNDVVLALVGASLRRYLTSHGELPERPLIAQVPVSVRVEGDKESGTKVAAMFASMATDLEDPGERLLTINRGTQSAKEMQRALAVDKIIGLSEAFSPGLIEVAARMYTAAQLDGRTPPIFNTIVSNVPGPPFPLYVAGARLAAMYPMGPLLYGGGLNISVISYLDSMDFGFLSCRTTVPDVWTIAEGIPLALKELMDTAPTPLRL